MAAQDANQCLVNLREYEGYYRKHSEKIAKRGGATALENTHITYPEMAQILSEINTIFKTVFGVGMKKNAIGQMYPEKRHWEVRG